MSYYRFGRAKLSANYLRTCNSMLVPFTACNGLVKAFVINLIPHFYADVIIYPRSNPEYTLRMMTNSIYMHIRTTTQSAYMRGDVIVALKQVNILVICVIYEAIIAWSPYLIPINWSFKTYNFMHRHWKWWILIQHLCIVNVGFISKKTKSIWVACIVS